MVEYVDVPVTDSLPTNDLWRSKFVARKYTKRHGTVSTTITYTC